MKRVHAQRCRSRLVFQVVNDFTLRYKYTHIVESDDESLYLIRTS